MGLCPTRSGDGAEGGGRHDAGMLTIHVCAAHLTAPDVAAS